MAPRDREGVENDQVGSHAYYARRLRREPIGVKIAPSPMA
jgi:hypothetical protein